VVAELTPRVLVDTDVLIDHLRGQRYARELLNEWSGRALVGVSTITHVEIYRGVREPQEERKTRAFLAALLPVPVSVEIAQRAGTAIAYAAQHGFTISIADGIVAATALELGIPLVTNNTAHYPFPELELVSGR
jgi:predicted nucleic acid-binding protein